MSQHKSGDPKHAMPLVAHLIELRNRLLRIVVAVLLLFLIFIPFANELYSLLAAPLMAHLPAETSMIATEVASPFLTPFKLTLVLSIFLAMPVVFYQGWSFVAPGLYSHEKRLMLPLLASSILLFYSGAAFAYFVVFPIVFEFFTSVAPEGVSVMTDISKYLDFVLKMFFAFGLAFEVPIATIGLVAMGVVSRESLASKRPYIIVAAFVLGMLLTPPDVISQTLLAVPMVILFELGLFFSKMFVRKPGEEEQDKEQPQAKPAEETPQQSSPGEPAAGHEEAPFEHSIDIDEVDLESEFERAEQAELELEDQEEPPAIDESAVDEPPKDK